MNNSLFRLVLTIFLLWLTIQLNYKYESYLAYVLILSVGILHGANDISLIKYALNKSKKSSKLTYAYLSLYLLIILTMAFMFFQFPIVALILFVLVSCFHFGEQHFYKHIIKNDLNTGLMFTGYGGVIFGLLFYFNAVESSSIIYELTALMFDKFYFLYFLLGSTSLFLLAFFMNYRNFKPSLNYLNELFLLVLFAIVFKLASLLWAFAIYFIVWHSVPSLLDQTIKLYGNIKRVDLIRYIKTSLPNWLVSLLGLGIFYYVSTLINMQFIVLFFAFLAAITIPHVIVMYYLNKSK